MSTRKSAISRPYSINSKDFNFDDPFAFPKPQQKNFSRPSHPIDNFDPPRYLPSDAGTGGSFGSFSSSNQNFFMINSGKELLEDDEILDMSEGEDEKQGSPRSIRSTHRLNFSDSMAYNNRSSSAMLGSDLVKQESYVDVELEMQGNYRHSARTQGSERGGWENEGGRRNKNKMICVGLLVLIAVIIIGVVVGVSEGKKSNNVVITTTTTSATPIISTTASSSLAASSSLTASTTSVDTTASSYRSIILPIISATPTLTPALSQTTYSIAYAYAINGITATVNLPYT